MSKILLIHKEIIDKIYNRAAELLLKSIDDQLKSGIKVLLLLSGGSAVNLYKRIKNYELRIRNLAIAQVDERFQPGKSYNIKHITYNKEDANAYQIEKTGLPEVCREKNIPYYLISQEGSLEQSAEEYNRQIELLFNTFSYKIGVFGIGEDAHTAGLLPGFEKVWNTDKFMVGYGLDNQRQNNPVGLFCPHKFKQRVTITPKTISQLDYGIVVATGEKKRKAIEQALDPININNLDNYPAAIIQKIKKVDLFTDLDLV